MIRELLPVLAVAPRCLVFSLTFCVFAFNSLAQIQESRQGALHGKMPPQTSPSPVDQEQFVAYWTSETGWKNVTYVGPNPFVFASPPYAPGYSFNWPLLGEQGPASATLIIDNHSHPPFQGPYKFDTSSSDQKYQFQCPYYQNNSGFKCSQLTAGPSP
jgi:hypothetical protein